MNDFGYQESEDDSLFVEVDPTGRYGRYNEILGKGASKTVYRAFDEYQGIEVAWNQVKLYDFLQSPEDLERLYCEIHLLKTLKHKNIMKFYTSWVDTSNRNINFITEMFTSGTLRQYRLKHKRVNIRAVKHWCRQILKGLLYLHSHEPPVIHRDLKCDNIFVNGNTGEVKIGDLGLAAILRKSHAAHCVGTPEFMAPEVYEEAYNELVDIYSFGMCVLEMVTFEYPYSECTHAAQIYKKVISGKKPHSLYKVKDREVRQFVEKCLASVSSRLSARELLDDPFLKIDDYESDLGSLEYGGDIDDLGPFIRQPLLEHRNSYNSINNGHSNGFSFEAQNEWGYHQVDFESSGIELFEGNKDDEHLPDVNISIKGKKNEDGSIFLRLRIADKKDHIRNIYFPFDIETDTALSVATEMVAELDITDQDVTEIADMIDGEITSLVPEWMPGPGIEETPHSAKQSLCDNCASRHTYTGSFMNFLPNYPGSMNPCCRHDGSLMHGRFEEIPYEADESDHHVKEVAPNVLSQSDCLHCLWDHQESRELSSQGSGLSHSDEDYEKVGLSIHAKGVESKSECNGMLSAVNVIQNLSGSRSSSSAVFSLYNDLPDNYENENQQDLRWLKAKYQMNLRELIDRQLRLVSKDLISDDRERNADRKCPRFPVPKLLQKDMELCTKLDDPVRNFSSNPHAHVSKRCPSSGTQTGQNCEVMESLIKDDAVTPKSFYTRLCLPHSLRRTSSLPVDAVDV